MEYASVNWDKYIYFFRSVSKVFLKFSKQNLVRALDNKIYTIVAGSTTHCKDRRRLNYMIYKDFLCEVWRSSTHYAFSI